MKSQLDCDEKQIVVIKKPPSFVGSRAGLVLWWPPKDKEGCRRDVREVMAKPAINFLRGENTVEEGRNA